MRMADVRPSFRGIRGLRRRTRPILSNCNGWLAAKRRGLVDDRGGPARAVACKQGWGLDDRAARLCWNWFGAATPRLIRVGGGWDRQGGVTDPQRTARFASYCDRTNRLFFLPD